MNRASVYEDTRKNIKQPKVTIITAVYNADKYLDNCIQSILTQTYSNFEYIIIDGGSSDGTVDIIKQYGSKIAYWVSESDKGIYDAWNKALLIAKGEWIVFVGADDVLHTNALELYINHISNHPQQEKLEFVSSLIELVSTDLLPLRIVGEPWQWDRFKHNMVTWHVGCFHAKHLFENYGNFDSSFKISGDYELLLRPKDKLIASFVNQSTALMRVGGVSSVRLYKAVDETYLAKIKNGVLSTYKGNFLRLLDRLILLKRSISTK